MLKPLFLGSAIKYWISWECWKSILKFLAALAIIIVAFVVILIFISSDIISFLPDSLRVIAIVLTIAVAAALSLRKLL